MAWNIKLYGSDNINLQSKSDSLATKTDVLALSDLVSQSIRVLSVYPKELHEADIRQAVGRIKFSNSNLRKAFDINVFPYDFTDSDYTEILNLSTVLNKKRIFLENIDFPLTIHENDNVICCIATAYEITDNNNNKPVSISLETERVYNG